jgi:acyl-coenzyme A synthetase/AMP-(fatty) acid ligase
VRVTLAPGPNPFLYLQANADASPDAVFAQSPDQVLTNAEAVVYAKKVAYEMRRLGVKAGDVVALDLPDMLSIVFTEAVYHEGGVSTVLPDGFVADGAFRVDWIFSRKTPTPQKNARVVMVDLRFLQQVDQNPYGITPSEAPIDILRIVLSSGTTGAPKAIAMGRDMELAMDAALASWFRSGPHLVLMDIGTARGIGELFLSVKGRRPFLSVGGATPAEIARVARQNSVKSVKGSPAQLVGLVDELEASGRTLPSIEKVYFSGTSMPPGLASRIRQVTEGCTVFSNYGSTEVGGIAVREYNSDDPFDAGKVSPGALLEIVDDDDVALPNGEQGRIRVKTPGMSTEYLGNPEATLRTFKDGWFYPGDLGVIRADKGLTLAGRESDIINAGGVKIDPARLDQFALNVDGVIDACSFGYTTTSGLLQIGIALVVEGDFDAQALSSGLTREFGAAAPRLIARVDSVPRTATGKPVRRTLAERFGES